MANTPKFAAWLKKPIGRFLSLFKCVGELLRNLTKKETRGKALDTLKRVYRKHALILALISLYVQNHNDRQRLLDSEIQGAKYKVGEEYWKMQYNGLYKKYDSKQNEKPKKEKVLEVIKKAE